MKAGKTITELVQEIEARANAKRDFVVPSAALTMAVEEERTGKPTALTFEAGDVPQHFRPNAITRTAEDLDDYDRATEFERAGGKVVELAKSDWREIAEAV